MKKKNLPVSDLIEPKEVIKTDGLAAFFRLVGQAEAFHVSELFSRAARTKILKLVRDKKLYKDIPGLTMRDVFKKLGIAKTTGYQELEAAEKFGGDMMELLDEMGVSTDDLYLLSRGLENVEGAKFEIVDVEKGQIRVDGRMLSAKQDTEAVCAAFQKALGALKRERLVVKGIEKKLEDREEKISGGQKQLKELEKELAGKDAEFEKLTRAIKLTTPISRALLELTDFVKQIEIMELTEDDKQYKGRYMQLINNMIIGRLANKFRPLGEDPAFAAGLAGQNEWAQEQEEEALDI